jgi:hypothetical protein
MDERVGLSRRQIINVIIKADVEAFILELMPSGTAPQMPLAKARGIFSRRARPLQKGQRCHSQPIYAPQARR